MNLFEEVKDRVTALQAAKFYGISVKRNGMACCPFHNDKTPSMKLDKRYHCFGCGADGDVISFVGQMFGLQPLDAAMKLNKDMGLMIPVPEKKGRKATRASPAENAERRKAEEARIGRAMDAQFEKAVQRLLNTYSDYFRLMGEWSWKYAPSSAGEDLHPLFVEAMRNRDHVEYILDLLLYGSKEDKAGIVIDKGKEVEALENRIRDIESGNGKRPPCGIARSESGHDQGRTHGTPGPQREEADNIVDLERVHDHNI